MSHVNEIKSVEDLNVFKKSHALALELYKITAHFPDEEKFSLVDQIRRAASSIGANLFEGSYRTGPREFGYFANVSRGSAGELKYFMMLSKDLEYITADKYDYFSNELDEISRMLYGLIKSLKQR